LRCHPKRQKNPSSSNKLNWDLARTKLKLINIPLTLNTLFHPKLMHLFNIVLDTVDCTSHYFRCQGTRVSGTRKGKEPKQMKIS
jgi:hypothetical protein